MRHPPSSRRCTSAISASRPTIGVMGTGGSVTARWGTVADDWTASNRSVSSTMRSSLTSCSSSSALEKGRYVAWSSVSIRCSSRPRRSCRSVAGIRTYTSLGCSVESRYSSSSPETSSSGATQPYDCQ